MKDLDPVNSFSGLTFIIINKTCQQHIHLIIMIEGTLGSDTRLTGPINNDLTLIHAEILYIHKEVFDHHPISN